MSDDQNERFNFGNNQEEYNQNVRIINDKNKINKFIANTNFYGIQDQPKQKNQQNKYNQQISEQDRLKDRKIRKLTNINKHLLEQLKQQNDQLTKKVNKQKYKFPKKSSKRISIRGEQNSKLLQSLKRQLQNAYRQIQFYKQNISQLKAKQIPIDEQDKVNEVKSRVKQKNELIEKLQNQLKTQKLIKYNQDKQLGKIQNDQLLESIKKIDQDIKIAKNKLKQAKHIIIKRQQLQKMQHIYFLELQSLIKKSKQNFERQQLINQKNETVSISLQQQITQQQWKQMKQRLALQKKKYEQYGKKFTYYNFMKSKHTKMLDQIDLKQKQKAKILERLESKLNEVKKLARLRPKPQILDRVDVKMQKLKDIISRQSTIQLIRSKNRVQSQDIRTFKKWQLQHASRDNAQLPQHNMVKDGIIKTNINNLTSYENQDTQSYEMPISNNRSQVQNI